MKSFNNDKSKYKYVFAIIDDRWNYQLHCSLHAASHFLTSKFYYDNLALEFDLEVTNGFYECIKRLVPSSEAQQKILIELQSYKSVVVLLSKLTLQNQTMHLVGRAQLLVFKFLLILNVKWFFHIAFFGFVAEW